MVTPIRKTAAANTRNMLTLLHPILEVRTPIASVSKTKSCSQDLITVPRVSFVATWDSNENYSCINMYQSILPKEVKLNWEAVPKEKPQDAKSSLDPRLSFRYRWKTSGGAPVEPRIATLCLSGNESLICKDFLWGSIQRSLYLLVCEPHPRFSDSKVHKKTLMGDQLMRKGNPSVTLFWPWNAAASQLDFWLKNSRSNFLPTFSRWIPLWSIGPALMFSNSSNSPIKSLHLGASFPRHSAQKSDRCKPRKLCTGRTCTFGD